MPKEIQEERRDAKKYLYMLVVLIGLVVLGSTYVAYTYFNTFTQDANENEIADVELTEIVPIEDDSTGFFENSTLGTSDVNPDDSFGINSGVKGSPAAPAAPAVSEVTVIPGEQLEPTKPSDTKGISNARTWKANDYKFGDIKIGKYTVIYGDTLWELAEGAYGNGPKWINIAKVNTIKYFPSGRPLINIGQILNIPEL